MIFGALTLLLPENLAGRIATRRKAAERIWKIARKRAAAQTQHESRLSGHVSASRSEIRNREVEI